MPFFNWKNCLLEELVTLLALLPYEALPFRRVQGQKKVMPKVGTTCKKCIGLDVNCH